MFTFVEAEDYRCLKKLRVELGPYQVLVGPNASGKSTLLDVIRFLSDSIIAGPKAAISDRSDSFYDLVWGRSGSSFRLAVEAKVPALSNNSDASDPVIALRYEVRVKLDPGSDDVSLDRETLTLRKASGTELAALERSNHRVKIRSEDDEPPFDFVLGPTQMGLANLPMDVTKYPSAVWFRTALQTGVQTVVLDNDMLRASSPPGQGQMNFFNGLNLPRRIAALADSRPSEFGACGSACSDGSSRHRDHHDNPTARRQAPRCDGALQKWNRRTGLDVVGRDTAADRAHVIGLCA